MRLDMPFEPRPIPRLLAVVSAVALAIPTLAAILSGDGSSTLEAFLWLFVLVPGFLLAYYRGAAGVATGLAMGMVAFSTVQVYLVLSGQRLPDWPLMLSITGALLLGSVLIGGLADRLHGEREEAKRISLLDPLTQLPNRRYFDLVLEREFAAAQRGRELVVVAFDLNGLKALNDRYGHAVGDEVIQAFAAVLTRRTRTMNLTARLGGDEFMTVLSDSTLTGAVVFVRSVLQHEITIEGVDQPVTASAGVARYRVEMTTPSELVAAADAALYKAKAQEGPAFVIHTVAPGANETEAVDISRDA
jgi:diguanylate cyclase (GGDEF)-like protein